MAILVLASCSDPADSGDAGPASETAAEETTLDELESRAAIPDDLPEEDFGGYLFRIATRSDEYSICDHLGDLYAEQLTGDVISDAVFNRNRKVEERFNFKIKPIVIDSKDEANPTNVFKRSVLAGDDEYDMIIDHMIHMGMAGLSHVFYNWYDVPHINFEKPWWVDDATTKLTIDGKSFFAIGDLSYNSIDYTYCMFFNKRLLTDYGIEQPYKTVRDRGWTIDYLISITKDVYQDLNSNQQVDEEDDLFGFCFKRVQRDGHIPGPLTTLSLCRMMRAIRSLCSTTRKRLPYSKAQLIFNDYTGVSVLLPGATKSGKSWVDYVPDMFTDGRAMIITGMFVYTRLHFRDFEDDYGILPYPLWDEKQKEYYTMLDGHGLMGIPVTVQDTKRTGIIVEALSAEGYKLVRRRIMTSR